MNQHPGNEGDTRRVRLFRNGRSQAVRIPKEFEFKGDEVEISRSENGDLVIHPLKKRSLKELLASMEPLGPEDQLPEIDDLPSEYGDPFAWCDAK